MTRMTIALGQMDVRPGQPDDNLERARALARQAHEARADLLLLPELWLHGYNLERAAEWAAPLDEGGFATMRSMAREFHLYLAGSLLEQHASGVSNTAVLYAPDGSLLGAYRKIHLFRMMEEPRYLAPGDHLTLCPTPWGPVGLTICYDLRFPEPFRTLALAGAVLFLLPAQWPIRRIEAWGILARARAVENELFVATCNRAGVEGDVVFPGRSAVIDPWGRVLVEGDDQEGLLVACADLREMTKARRYLTVYQDRRPEAYRVVEMEGHEGAGTRRQEDTGKRERRDRGKVLEVAIEIAHEAGALVRQGFGQAQQVAFKSANNPVTATDTAAERLIRTRLHQAFPSHRFLAEESGGDDWRADGPPIWVVDPLDGTVNFAHNFPHVGISLALVEQGEPVVGVIYDPLRDETFTAIAGEGAWLNGAPIHVTGVARLADAFLATGFSYDRGADLDDSLAYFVRFMHRSQGVRRAGAATLDLAHVACGRFDGFWEQRLSPWDVAAGILLIREAGGVVSDFAGEQATIGSRSIVAANPILHGEMMGVINETRADRQ